MNKTPEYMKFVLDACLATSQFDEAEKRIKYSPFTSNDFKWWLVHENGPLFFVVRDLLRRGNHVFSVCPGTPLALTSLDYSVIITPWSAHTGHDPVKVRGSMMERSLMPLYVESGEWECPQMNPVFDWTEDQAWAYLIHRNLVEVR
jgi:hypothetical protein